MSVRAAGHLTTGVLALSVALAGALRSAAGTTTLVSPHEPPPTIVIGAEATPCEQYAAEEMATYLGRMTGRRLDVVDDGNVLRAKSSRSGGAG